MATNKIMSNNWIEFENLTSAIGQSKQLPNDFNELLFAFNNSYYAFFIYATKAGISATARSNGWCELIQGGGNVSQISAVWFRIILNANTYEIHKVILDGAELSSGYSGKLYYR